MINYKSNDVKRIYHVVGLLLLFVFCNVGYKLAFHKEKISGSKMNRTLHLETLVLVELICHLHITATVMIMTFVLSGAGVSDIMLKCLYAVKPSEVLEKNVIKNRICRPEIFVLL